MIGVTIVGLPETMAVLRRSGTAATGLLAGALYNEAQIIMNRSQSLVPYETGDLQRSGTVQPPIVAGSHVEVVLGYGGIAQAYAVDQHENPNYRHAAGLQWHYLSDPVDEAASTLDADLASLLVRLWSV